jgi:hypothetical protein
MPNVRHARYVLARTGDTWPGQRDDWAGMESGGIRMSLSWGRASLGLREPYHFET